MGRMDDDNAMMFGVGSAGMVPRPVAGLHIGVYIQYYRHFRVFSFGLVLQ